VLQNELDLFVLLVRVRRTGPQSTQKGGEWGHFN
jgi:hypothetical protein